MIYKRGSQGEVVRQIQKALYLYPDGIFGPLTEELVKQFQKENGLVVDGIVGEKTLAKLYGVTIKNASISVHITPSKNRPIKYVAIHYTAGSTSRKGAAMSTRSVFLQPKRRASADFVVDDGTIAQINPNLNNYYTWSVGDKKNPYSGGGTLYGMATNRNTISIEICSNLIKGYDPNTPNHQGWYFTEASLDNALRLVRYLMACYGIPKENVVRHYDVSGKLCPGVVGWNNGKIYGNDGRPTGWSNNSEEWKKFLKKI